MSGISVIIPTLNEESRIALRLTELQRQAAFDEVIVSDGGSADRTCALVAQFSMARLVRAERGRARQMNAGAAVASGDVLLFLHADVSLPADAARWVHRTLDVPGVVAGAFRTWHVDDSDQQRSALWLHLADLRSRYTSLPYGDQALFLRAHTFREVGGFADQSLMEDLELALRLRRRGAIRTAPRSVQVSGRRFLAHPLRYALTVNLFPLLYRAGLSPARLHRWYDDIR